MERGFDFVLDGAEIVPIPGRGNGVVATRGLAAGTCLFTEYPLIAMQHGDNVKAGVSVCERCFRFLGPLESQMNSLLCVRVSPARAPEKLPVVSGMHELPAPVSCPGRCNLRFCSEECATQNFAEHHRLLCPGAAGSGSSSVAVPLPVPPPAPPSATDELAAGVGGMRVGRMRVDMQPAGEAQVVLKLTAFAAVVPTLESKPAVKGSAAAIVPLTPTTANTFEDLPSEPLARFVAHANATNEIFLLAAKAAALVLCRTEAEGASGYDAAMAPFAMEPMWWDAVATPDDVSDEKDFRRTLRELLTESWTLLCALVGPRAPSGCAFMATPAAYATIVGAFERRNCALQVASPVEAYFLAIDAMDEGEAKAAVTAVTAPLLDALDEAYSTPCEGTGLFPLQATLNHSCEPNVTLLKEEGLEERDGRVVARLTRNVAAGEELCNSYVDTSLPVKRRRRELREYGFECDCPKCVRELKAASEKKAAKDGKRRLK